MDWFRAYLDREHADQRLVPSIRMAITIETTLIDERERRTNYGD